MTTLNTQTSLPISNSPVRGVHLQWPVDFGSQGLTFYVVEPVDYAPGSHATLFGQLVSASLAPPGRGGGTEDARGGLIRFDLMTFPEAFLSAEDFLTTLDYLSQQQASPIFHVGLRATNDDHLFTVAQLRALIEAVRARQGPNSADLQALSDWTAGQLSTEFFNVAALFLVDAEGDLRVCLHPKNVPSPIEAGVLPGDTVTGADFLCAVTLKPQNPLYRRVVVQPLICSDLLDLRTPRGGPGPMEALCTEADRLGSDAPDHIDVISVVTCTPQDDLRRSTDMPVDLMWKPKFLKAFSDAYTRAQFNRHDAAVFVMSNFRRGPEKSDGSRPDHGLAGCCVPVPPAPISPAESLVWGHGRHGASGQDLWERMDRRSETFQPLRLLLAIAPSMPVTPVVARLMRFTMPILPRFQPRQTPSGPTDVLVSNWPTSSGSLIPTSEVRNV